MIYQYLNSKDYISNFVDKFHNFAQKSPILLSFVTSDKGVTIVHENSNTKYFYEWDFSVPVKGFIHMIKQNLREYHYPRISREESIEVPLTDDDKANLLAEGTNINDLPKSKTILQKQIYCIDKIIALKDVFIIINEATKESYRYKMNYSGIYFLKNYRSGKYKDLDEAGDFFFKKSTLLDKLTQEE